VGDGNPRNRRPKQRKNAIQGRKMGFLGVGGGEMKVWNVLGFGGGGGWGGGGELWGKKDCPKREGWEERKSGKSHKRGIRHRRGDAPLKFRKLFSGKKTHHLGGGGDKGEMCKGGQ